MRSPFTVLHLLVFLVLLALLMAMVYVGAVTVAADKLGLSQGAVIVLLFGSLLGSHINLPMFTVRAQRPPETLQQRWTRMIRLQQQPFRGRTIIAINLGGALIPVAFSAYLLTHQPVGLLEAAGAIALVAAISYIASRPIPGVGVGMPILIAPLSAAVVAMLLSAEHSPPLAYIGGTLGVLLGADLLRLPDIRRMGVNVAAIGGAGTFDGIFITGIVAVLLA